jgi:hypothetical protein
MKGCPYRKSHRRPGLALRCSPELDRTQSRDAGAACPNRRGGLTVVSVESMMISMEPTVDAPQRLRRTAAPKLESHLGYWLRRVSNQVSGAFARALQTRHTSVAEWVVMCQLQERPGITPGELAGRLELTRGAVPLASNSSRRPRRSRTRCLTLPSTHWLSTMSR